MFKEWFGKDVNFQLLYKASQDGWTAANFHTKCDNKGATITLIKSEFGKTFGGFTTA